MRQKPDRCLQESPGARRARARRVCAALARLYPQARITLDFTTPWQCLVATVLSAQCTDERVNRTTPELFRRFPDADAMSHVPLEEIQSLIRPTGFFRQKAKALKAAASAIQQRFKGQVPDSMEDLLTLPGVGRKTANVLLGHVFGQPALVVDTHVRRLALRLGFTVQREADAIEQDLQQLVPASDWTPFSMRLILHGRRVCHARSPRCAECSLRSDCPRITVSRPSTVFDRV